MISPTIITTAMPHGYNASVERFDGRLLFSYRYHQDKTKWRTQIMIQDSGENWVRELHLKLPEQYAGMSHEDARFFIFRGKLYLSLTVAVFPSVPNVPPPCITIYGRLELQEDCWRLVDVIEPKYGGNDWSGQVKNNVFFDYEGRLHQIFQCSPEQIIVRVKEDGSVDKVFRTKSPSWIHGEIRGGTQPLGSQLIGEAKWLRFFHSLHKHGNDRGDWTYAIGALVMQAKPPFQIERISRFPVFSGDERFVPHWQFWKQGVAIPYGAVSDGSGWLVSAGLNDSMVAKFSVKLNDLNL